MAIEHVASRWGISLSRSGEAYQVQTTFRGQAVTLALPLAWMNQTGFVVQALLDTYQSNSPKLIVIYDDLDLPLGVLRIKVRGGPGGHNGLRSLIMCLGFEEFFRIKIGIGRPGDKEDPSDYVLSPFNGEEQQTIEQALPRVAEALECLISSGATEAMNRFHRTLPPRPSGEDIEKADPLGT